MKGKIPSIVTVERVLELLQKAPMTNDAIGVVFRQRRSRGRDRFSRDVAACLLILFKDGKVMPTKGTQRKIRWNAL